MWIGSNVKWYGPLHAGGVNHQVPTLLEFELDGRYLYEEKIKLIESLEDFIVRLEFVCDNPKCSWMVCHI